MFLVVGVLLVLCSFKDMRFDSRLDKLESKTVFIEGN